MGFEQVNGKVIAARVDPAHAVVAKRGTMLGYQGTVAFRPVTHGGGVGGMVGAVMSGESTAMMVAEGTGRVMYGYRGLHVTVVDLTGDSLVVEADRLLAFESTVQTSVELIAQGGVRAAVRGAVTGQGVATTRVSGTGAVAVLSHGGTLALTLSGETVGVDPQAYVGHVGALRVDLAASVGMRDLVGRGSGEAMQLQIGGHGTVYVQASERTFR